MNRLNSQLTAVPLAVLLAGSAAFAQSSFQNLDFESANLPQIPPGQYGGWVQVSSAIPGWTVYLGNVQQTKVMQNGATAGSAAVIIDGPGGSEIIDGSYSVQLFQGYLGAPSISQTALVPASAQWLTFDSYLPSGGLQVTMAGQVLSLVSLGSGPTYTAYGANISAWAGQTATLSFTQNAGMSIIDGITFSAVPEPSVIGLSALGALLCTWRFICRKP